MVRLGYHPGRILYLLELTTRTVEQNIEIKEYFATKKRAKSRPRYVIFNTPPKVC